MKPSAPSEGGTIPNTGLTFEDEAGAVLRDLRDALMGILEGFRPPVVRASQLRRLLGLSQQVSWGLFNAMTARDARALASLLPGRRAMDRFFDAAREQGVGAERVERARAAFERFEATAARHAGSRSSFETMVADLGSGEGDAGTILRHKRAVSRGMSHLWGWQARLVCGIRIMHPSATPGLLDTVFIKGMVGVRRTRRTVPLQLTAYRGRPIGPGDPVPQGVPEPLDPRETGPDAIGLLQDFCSKPLPRFRPRVGAQGYRCHELVDQGLGAAGEVTYFTGESCRADTAAPGSVPGAGIAMAKSMDIPIEVFTADLLMHRSTCDTRVPEVRVFACPLDGSMEVREADLLPMTERADYLGEGVSAGRTPLIPRYSEMVGYAMDRMGWNAEEFRVFRCKVEYPVMHTRVLMVLR